MLSLMVSRVLSSTEELSLQSFRGEASASLSGFNIEVSATVGVRILEINWKTVSKS